MSVLWVHLRENPIHDLGSQDYLAVWNGRISLGLNTVVKPLDEFFHPGILMKPLGEEALEIARGVPQMLFGGDERWQKVGQVALVGAILVTDQAATDVVDGERVLRAADSQLIEPRRDLGRKAEESRRAAEIANQYPQLI